MNQSNSIIKLEKLYKNKEWLYDQYITQKKTKIEIAKNSHCSSSTVLFYIRKYNIKKKYENKEWLYNQYIILKKSARKIAIELGCDRSTIGKALTKYNIQKRNKSESNTGEFNPRWKGKGSNHEGYKLIWCPEHPMNSRNYVTEHRFIIEKKIGRYLKSSEIVHHINGIKTDNRIENLYLYSSRSDHKKGHNSINNLIEKLLKRKIIEFKDGKYRFLKIKT